LCLLQLDQGAVKSITKATGVPSQPVAGFGEQVRLVPRLVSDGEPVLPNKDQAIEYAQNRACFRSGEIRVLDSTGKLERTVAFSEADRKL